MASYEEYEDYLRNNLNALERLGDKFGGVDERLDYVVQQLLDIQIKPETIAMLEKLSGLIEDLKEVGYVMPVQTQQIVFEKPLGPLQGARLEDVISLDGKILSVGFHWPLGCNALVGMAVGHSSKQFMPIVGFLSLNDASPVYLTSEEAKRDETVWCIMENHDGRETHNISATVTIVGE